MKTAVIISLIAAGAFVSCEQKPAATQTEKARIHNWKEPKTLAYELKSARQWLDSSNTDLHRQEIVFAVNRTDRKHFAEMDSVLIPTDLSGDLVCYLPFPAYVEALKDVKKIIFFSYAVQAFGAYENGELVYGGQTNMGRENDQTPTGLFFTNWKAKKTISTFNDEWELRWNFNIANKAGVGWHQYELPGYPSSHSCLRLTEKDAKHLYTWADQWILKNKNEILVKGTPVIVFGSYDFAAPKPWLKLISNPHALDLSEKELANVAKPFLNEVLAEQQNSDAYHANELTEN